MLQSPWLFWKDGRGAGSHGGSGAGAWGCAEPRCRLPSGFFSLRFPLKGVSLTELVPAMSKYRACKSPLRDSVCHHLCECPLCSIQPH